MRSSVEARLAELKLQKQQCARRFGEAKRAGLDLAPLKAEMENITRALREIESSGTAKMETAADAPQQHTPARFQPQNQTPNPRGSQPRQTLQIHIADKRDEVRWQEYVDTHPAATLCHDFRWRHVLGENLGHKPLYLIATASERVCGVLPIIRQKSYLFGDFATSMPFLNYGGPLVDDSDVAVQLLSAAQEIVLRLGSRHLEVRNSLPLGNWPQRSDKQLLWRQLPDSVQTLDQQLGSKLRAQIKRPIREGATTKHGGVELFADFYRVFAENMRDLGTPVYGAPFFLNILRYFASETCINVVYVNGKPVGAAFLLSHRNVMEVPWASTVRAANPIGANMLLYWENLALAINRRHTWFDFGRSSQDAGTYKFKLQWGAQPFPSYWQYALAPGSQLPSLNPSNPKYALAIKVWQRLPLPLTKWLGPHLVKRLP